MVASLGAIFAKILVEPMVKKEKVQDGLDEVSSDIGRPCGPCVEGDGKDVPRQLSPKCYL